LGLKPGSLALFGAGEGVGDEDLAPLAVVLEDIGDQMFITTQLYEESKHTDFFSIVTGAKGAIHTEEERRGRSFRRRPTRSGLRALRRTVRAQRAGDGALPEADTPENRAKAHRHYHLTIEGFWPRPATTDSLACPVETNPNSQICRD